MSYSSLKCNSAMIAHEPSLVGWMLGCSVGWSVCHNFKRGRQVTLPCSYRGVISKWLDNLIFSSSSFFYSDKKNLLPPLNICGVNSIPKQICIYHCKIYIYQQLFSFAVITVKCYFNYLWNKMCLYLWMDIQPNKIKIKSYFYLSKYLKFLGKNTAKVMIELRSPPHTKFFCHEWIFFDL